MYVCICMYVYVVVGWIHNINPPSFAGGATLSPKFGKERMTKNDCLAKLKEFLPC